MDHTVETLEDEETGVTTTVYMEEDAEFADPRQDCNIGVMLCAHGRYGLGDTNSEPQLPEDPDDLVVTCETCQGTGDLTTEFPPTPPVSDMDCPKCEGEGRRRASVVEWVKAKYEVVGPVLMLGLIDHSGISMYVGGGSHWSDNAGWDSGTVGIIFATRETIAETGCPEDQIEIALDSEVQEYDRWLRGEVFYIVCEDADGDHLDSCGGYLGHEYAVEEAKGMHTDAIESALRERTEAAEWASRDVVTI